MATNVYIKHVNEPRKEELKYIEELKATFIDKKNAIKQVEKKIEQYEELSKKLQSIHEQISYDIIIPISEYEKKPLCFIKGKLVHTNEVLMPIGTTYYAKISTSDGISQCIRKIEDIKEQIIELEFEKKAFLEKMIFLQQGSMQPGQVEIIEEYSDDVSEPRSRRRIKNQMSSNSVQ